MVFTMTWISVPAPSVGNINLGDCMVILSAFLLGWSGAIASAAGAALCDLVSGYVIYAPGTFIIKALMVTAIILTRKVILKGKSGISFIVSGIIAEIIMIIGYFVYEALVLKYGVAAIANLPFNAIQGVANLIIAVLLLIVLNKSKIINVLLDKSDK